MPKSLKLKRYFVHMQHNFLYISFSSFMEDIRKLAKSKIGAPLRPWLNSIRNQLWYAFANCSG